MYSSDAKWIVPRFAMVLSFCVSTQVFKAEAAATEKLTDSEGREFLVALPSTPFTQAAVKQTPASPRIGPNRKAPFFHVGFALPIPPHNSPAEAGSIAGIDASVMGHLHSPGFEILLN